MDTYLTTSQINDLLNDAVEAGYITETQKAQLSGLFIATVMLRNGEERMET